MDIGVNHVLVGVGILLFGWVGFILWRRSHRPAQPTTRSQTPTKRRVRVVAKRIIPAHDFVVVTALTPSGADIPSTEWCDQRYELDCAAGGWRTTITVPRSTYYRVNVGDFVNEFGIQI